MAGPGLGHTESPGTGQGKRLRRGQAGAELGQATDEIGRGQAVLEVGGGGLVEDGGQRAETVVAGQAGPDAGHQGGGGGVGGEGHHAGHGFVEDETERVDVGAAVHRTAEGLFRRGVAGGADGGTGRFGHGGLGQGPGQTEVGDAEAAVLVEDEVGRFDVAVDEAATVRVGEGLGGLDTHGRGLGHRDTAAVVEQVPQGPAAQVLEDQEGAALVLAPVVDGEDVGVGQGGGGLGLVAEAAQEVAVVGQAGVEDLDGHPALEDDVPGGVDGRGSPAAEGGFDPVAAREDPPDGVGGGRHGSGSRLQRVEGPSVDPHAW